MIFKGMKLKNFKLTQRNQKGQVAIFVALIFQVIFIFFAVLINVGLLVHHKINLQQSTDMAAYYGAMKQAEMLNVISHINFQIRQAWKLMTWRYRILGTFMFSLDNPQPPGNTLTLPITLGPSAPPDMNYTPGVDKKCSDPLDVNLNNAPIFCVAHSGFGDWNAPVSETPCKVSCNKLNMFSTAIASISLTGGASVPGASSGAAVNTAILAANAGGREQCRVATKVMADQFTSIVTAYFRELNMRTTNFSMLARNLLKGKDDFVDLEGKKVYTGAELTFKNNLTEANLSSNPEFSAINGMSNENSANQSCLEEQQVFNKIKYQVIQFFLSQCAPTAADIRNDFYVSPHDIVGPPVSDAALQAKIDNVKGILSTGPAPTAFDKLKTIMDLEFSTGFEKNPYCQSYYAVRARSKPKIPFLPLSQVELTAVSVAKPFGGSVGPWFYDKWDKSSTASQPATQVDKMLPMLKINAGASSAIKQNISVLPNYSLFVGDEMGLSRREFIAVYHDFLLNRHIEGVSSIASTNHSPTLESQPIAGGATQLRKPQGYWPQLKDWDKITKLINDTDYDPLPINNNSNSRIRDLEISAIAPNAFELSYYSIDSDFYNNYYEKYLSKDSFVQKVTNGLSVPVGESKITFRPDFGYTETLGGVPEGKKYSIRHQLSVANEIFKKAGNGISQLRFANLVGDPEAKKYFFTYVPSKLSSLLTGWTYINSTDEQGYSKFPKDGPMPFGICNDPSNNFGGDTNEKFKSITDVDGGKYPPATGNCVTGGRTGYSVKIISVDALNGPQGDIGNTGSSGQTILNPIPTSFINF